MEILSKSTEERDRGIKKLDYQQHHVKEYWIIDADLKIIEQYLLSEEGEYNEPLIYGIKDKIPCHVVKGLEIPLKAIFNAADNLAFVQKIVS